MVDLLDARARTLSEWRAGTLIEITSVGRHPLVWAVRTGPASSSRPCAETERNWQRAEVSLGHVA